MVRYVDVALFEQAWLKRLSQFSTVIVFRTVDPKRLEAFLHFIHEKLSELRDTVDGSGDGECSELSRDVYLYVVGLGLHRVRVDNGDILYEPVVRQLPTAQTPLVRELAGVAQPGRIEELDSAITFLKGEFERKCGIAAIFYGLFNRDDRFVAFIRGSVLMPTLYRRYHTIVIFTDVPHVVLDEDTLKLTIYVDVRPSSDREREELIRHVLDSLSVTLDEDVIRRVRKRLHQLVQLTRGLTLHDVESVLLYSIYRYRDVRLDVVQELKYEIVRKVGILEVEEPQHGFESVGGYDYLKEFIRDNVINVLRNPEKAKRLGLRPPRGILLFGPGGTGKTWLARALAKELGIPFLRLRTEKIVSEYYGRTERNMARALELAESIAPCVLFIDEVDRFGRRASLVDSDSGTTRRVFSMLLEWLGDSNRQTIVIATTNAPEQLDAMFIRVGRFDYIIPVLYPDFKARVDILKVHTQVVRKVPLAEDVDLEEIARLTELWTGAELEELVLRAARIALKRGDDIVKMEHFREALRSFRINYDERKMWLTHYLTLAEKYCNDLNLLQQLKRQYEKYIGEEKTSLKTGTVRFA